MISRSSEKTAVFIFGVVFLIAILVLAVWIPKPTPPQFFAFRLTLALSAAGIGALLPGFLKLDLALPLQGGMRAGGALALFASVWFFNPATLGVEIVPPNNFASALIDKFIELTDAHDHRGAYALYALRTRERINEEAYVSMGKNVRDPLGGLEKRVLINADTPNMLGGVTGAFVVQTYQSRFSGSGDVWIETVSTIPENEEWRINSYNIFRCEPPLCAPLASLSP